MTDGVDSIHCFDPSVPKTRGLTKREYFAATALIAAAIFDRGDADGDWTVLAPNAVKLADALIAELNK